MRYWHWLGPGSNMLTLIINQTRGEPLSRVEAIQTEGQPGQRGRIMVIHTLLQQVSPSPVPSNRDTE